MFIDGKTVARQGDAISEHGKSTEASHGRAISGGLSKVLVNGRLIALIVSAVDYDWFRPSAMGCSMALSYAGLQFTVKVGVLPESTFVVASFELEERTNRPCSLSRLSLKVARALPDVDFSSVLGQPCELLVWYNGGLQHRGGLRCGRVCARG